jgi:hypothetical protein
LPLGWSILFYIVFLTRFNAAIAELMTSDVPETALVMMTLMDLWHLHSLKILDLDGHAMLLPKHHRLNVM